MFINTGDTGGSQGPWISWSSNGSAEKGFAPRSWVLRDKDEHGGKVEIAVPAFETGCVLDLSTLQIGWEKDGASGQAPERRWNPDLATATPRPDDSKKQSGSFAWSRALSVRCAIGDGKAATWEQGSFGAMKAFDNLANLLNDDMLAGKNTPGHAPLVIQSNVEAIQLKSGSANVPVLTIQEWVPMPDCLKPEAAPIASGEATAGQVDAAQRQAAATTQTQAAPAAGREF